MEPVVRLLPADRTPVLVPIGMLSLLPLHAAPVGRSHGLRPMSHAPNARGWSSGRADVQHLHWVLITVATPVRKNAPGS
jgi:hypothetical protein